jgi:hypothetical protein
MPRPPFENPYHHPCLKPHVFDHEAVSNLCRDCFEIAMATFGVGALWNEDLVEFKETPDWSFPLLVAQHQKTAEARISSILLSLAATYRALDDQLSEVIEFEDFIRKQKEDHVNFLTVYKGNVRDSLRECCNKIIHAEDIRPVYDNSNEPQGEGKYHMTGTIELSGVFGKAEWVVSFGLFEFLEAMLETVDFYYSGGSGD